MLLWQRPLGMRTFGLTRECAKMTASLAANQGLYNGFLSAGLASVLTAPPPTAFHHLWIETTATPAATSSRAVQAGRCRLARPPDPR
ncbi:MAG: DUF1304 domain-containing protein [Candidatus Limnocylindrales bacterium]